MTWRTSLWLAFRGGRSDRLRIALTVASTALSAAFVLLAAAFLRLAGDGGGPEALAVWRAGLAAPTALALLLLALVGLGLAVDCGRVGEPVRRRRVRNLALLGVSRRSLRRLAALEGGATSLIGVAGGSALYGLVAFVVARVGSPYGVWDGAGRRVGWAWDPEVHLLPTSRAPLWWVVVPGLLALPLLVTVGAYLAERDGVGRTRPTRRRLRVSLTLLLVSPAVLAVGVWAVSRVPGTAMATALTAVTVSVAAAALARGALGFAEATSLLLGRVLAERTRTAATLLAARRLSGGEAAGGSGLGTLLVGCVVGGAAVGVYALQLAGAARVSTRTDATSWWVVMALVGVAVATVVGSVGLMVRELEAIVSRRRSLATAVAAGVPRGVLRRAAVLEAVVQVLPLAVLGAALGAFGAQALAPAWADVPPASALVSLGLLGVLVLCVLTAVVLAAGVATLALPASTDVSEARVPA